MGSQCLDNKYNVHVLTAFVLSENMQPKEGSQPNYSRDSPTKMQSLSENEPTSHTNPSTLDSGFAGCLSYTSNRDYTSSLDTPYVHQQPATLNLPAVLWDKPAGSKIRVPPPVPPMSSSPILDFLLFPHPPSLSLSLVAATTASAAATTAAGARAAPRRAQRVCGVRGLRREAVRRDRAAPALREDIPVRAVVHRPLGHVFRGRVVTRVRDALYLCGCGAV